jgi:iron complex transport system substrate-binding protein
LTVALCLASALAHAAELNLVDDRGVTVHLSAPASRVVTLSPHLAEIVFAAGAEETLVGVALHSDFPPSVQRLPKIGDAVRIDVERILALRADLVLAWGSGNPSAHITQIERLGVPVFVTEPHKLEDVSRVVRNVGVLTGASFKAEQAARKFEMEIDTLRRTYGARRPVRVFYEIWHRPLMTVSSAHMISDVLRLCGGVNIFADVPALAPTVSMEALLAARPQAIVGGGSSVDERVFIAQWESHALDVLKDVALVYVPADHIQRATPRIVQGVRAVCSGLDTARATRR